MDVILLQHQLFHIKRQKTKDRMQHDANMSLLSDCIINVFKIYHRTYKQCTKPSLTMLHSIHKLPAIMIEHDTKYPNCAKLVMREVRHDPYSYVQSSKLKNAVYILQKSHTIPCTVAHPIRLKLGNDLGYGWEMICYVRERHKR